MPEGMQAAPKAGETETKDNELMALRDAVGAISKRLDALFPAKPAKKDAAEGDNDKEASGKGKRRTVDDWVEDKDADAETAHHEDEDDHPNHRPGKARQLAADAAGSDEDQRGVDQQRFDAVLMSARGERAPPPMMSETRRAYRLRLLSNLKEFSPEHAKLDLSKIKDGEVLDMIDAQITARADACGRDSNLLQQAVGGSLSRLREHRKIDQSGRTITSFVGPVSETLAPFIRPPLRLRRINTRPDGY